MDTDYLDTPRVITTAVNGESIRRRLKEGKDINIFLDTCNTGSPYGSANNFSQELGKELRELLDYNGYKNIKINITAPSGSMEWPSEYIPWSRSPASDIITPMYIPGVGNKTGSYSVAKLEYYKY